MDIASRYGRYTPSQHGIIRINILSETAIALAEDLEPLQLFYTRKMDTGLHYHQTPRRSQYTRATRGDYSKYTST